jgi:penicillin-binding protein 1A
VAAYNTFPSKGVYISPLLVTRIEDRQGNVLSEFTNRKREAIGEQTAYLMTNLMQGVVQGGTAVRLRYRYNLMGEIAGKTGTTNDNADGWFIGFTPTLTAGVWTGAEDRQVHFQSITYGQGAHMSLPTWALFMQKIIADGTLGVSANDRFIAPAGMDLNLDCDEIDESVTEHREIEDYYFE